MSLYGIPFKSLKKCGLYYCINRNFSEPQKPHFIIESGFKSRAGYNGTCTVRIQELQPRKISSLSQSYWFATLSSKERGEL